MAALEIAGFFILGILGGVLVYIFGIEKKATGNSDGKREVPSEEMTSIFCVRKDLKMGRGKIAAQCGHAILGIFRKLLKQMPGVAHEWHEGEFPKKFFYCEDELQMLSIEEQARASGYQTIIIHDAGLTQIAAGSATVLGIAPVPFSRVGELTSNLKVLD
jgi:PTH2 family peptidyl-tRNA hydrolase